MNFPPIPKPTKLNTQGGIQTLEYRPAPMIS